MNGTKSILLAGIGTAGSTIAREIRDAFDGNLRTIMCDTDAATAQTCEPFVLLGGNRLAGRGAGGDIVAGRMAAEESISAIDSHLDGVRIAVIVTTLGGGTGGGATLETVKHLARKGIPSIVFATVPFTFEGDDRQRHARSVMRMIEDAANASFFIPLNDLAAETDNMKEAFDIARARLETGITFFWRLLEKPGYLRLDAERLRNILSRAGHGRFAAVETSGENRAREALDRLLSSPAISGGTGTVRAILCGILAGDDLRLSEVGIVAGGLRKAFSEPLRFDLATVNDEESFGGRIAAVAMLFESTPEESSGNKPKSVLSGSGQKNDRFVKSEATIWHGENMDEPTYLRKGISLGF